MPMPRRDDRAPPASPEDAREAAEHTRLALEASGLGTWSWEAATDRFRADARCRAICGYDPVAPLDYTIAASRIHPEDRPRVDAALRKAIDPAEGGIYAMTFRSVHADGSVRWCSSRAQASFEVRDGKRRIARIVGVTLDITDQLATERALHASEDRYRVVIESSPIGFTMLRAVRDGTGRIVDFVWLHLNPSAGRILGRAPADLMGRAVSGTLVGVWNTTGLFEAFVRIVESRQPERLEIESAVEDVPGTFAAVCAPFEDGLATWFEDITARKSDEHALRTTQAELRKVTDLMAAGVVRVSRDLRYLWVSRRYAEWVRRPIEEIAGRPIVEVLGAAAMARLRPYFDRVLSGVPVDYEEEIDYPSIGRRWIRAAYEPARDANGEPDGWVAVVSDITTRKAIENRLAEADRRKDEFLATLAHELRNPLAALSAASHLLVRSTGDAAVTAKASETLVRQVEQMSRLLDDLLDVSRITSGKLTLRREPVDLRDAIEMAVDTARPAIDAKQHRLALDLPAEPVFAVADVVRLGQVFANLLVNAAKYTDPCGEIGVGVRIEGGELVATVSDTGIGIASAALPRIFEMFSQAHGPIDRGEGGLGIGLALTKALVEMHGGTVTAESGGPGGGSAFTVRLPIAPTPIAIEHPAARRDAPAVRRRILLVDDNRDALESLALLLETDGHAVRTADDGDSALALAAAEPPDIVLLDIGMPVLDGYEVARRLRAMASCRNAAIVAVSGWGQVEHKRRTAEAGFDYHLTKPVDWRTLRALLADVTRTREGAGG
jgi:PAS domain S-box-containing protein